MRTTKTPAGQRSTAVSSDDVKQLHPFRNLHPNMLQNVAEHSRLEQLQPGAWQAQDSKNRLYFLRRGQLKFTNDAHHTRELSHDVPAARFPLPCSGQWQISAASVAELVSIPSRYLELDRSQHPEKTIELQDDEVIGEVYMQFYQALKNDQYELPSLPDLAVRIGKAIDDPDTFNEDIARLIQMDPSLATRVMSVVNSAAFGGVSPVRTLQQAVARLGRQQVRNLVFSCIIKGLFRTDSMLLKKRMQALWSHSARVAAISFVLARVTPGLDPNQAMLAGLVHDIGAIPILQMAREHPKVSTESSLLDPLIDSLKAEIGALTLAAWNFDHQLVNLARQAEHWFRIGTALPDYLDVVLLAQLHAFIGDPAGSTLPRIDTVPAFRKLALGQLTPRHSIGVLDHAARDIDEVENLLKAG